MDKATGLVAAYWTVKRAMKLFATSAYETHEMLDTLKEYAAKDRHARHELVDSAADADAILFTENTHFDDYLFSNLSEHPLVKAFPEKVFMYNESDKPWSALPGLYCSMPKRFFQPSKQIAFPYLSTPNEFIKDVYKRDVERKWLFSFVGSVSHRSRRDVVALGDVSRGVKDTSEFNVWDCTDDVKAAQGSVFADTMAASWFMLCPRGIGTSSYRLFETLEAGRAPVIMSDQWVPTPHINWDFAIKVREKDIKNIPEILRSVAGEAKERGDAARAAWESAYAPDTMFDTVCESVAWLIEEHQHKGEAHPLRQLRKLAIATDLAAIQSLRALRKSLLHSTS
jgi:hypothetical protein